MSADRQQQPYTINRSDSVVLTPAVAGRIVQRVGEGLGVSASVTRHTGSIVASTDAGVVGLHSHTASGAIAANNVCSSSAERHAGLACPLEYDGEVVGALVLHGDPARLAPSIRLAKTLAELLIHQMTVIDQLGSLEQRRATFVADLLLGRLLDPREISRAAALVGIDPTVPRVGVAVRVDGLMREASSPRPTESLPTIFNDWRERRARTHLVEWVLPRALCGPDDICSVVDGGWLALLTRIDPDGPPDHHVSAVRRRVAPVVRELAESGDTSLCAGIGHHYPGVTGLAASFAEAQFAAAAGYRLLGSTQIVTIEELGLAGLVGEAASGTKDRLVDQTLGPLVGEPDLLETTRVFFRHDLAPAATAAALQIHRHTLAYRLDKVRRLTGLDPRRFRDAAQLHAALLIGQLRPDTTGQEMPGGQEKRGQRLQSWRTGPMTGSGTACNPSLGEERHDVHSEATRARVRGHITVVQERRFLLVTDDGRGCQLTLAHDAEPDVDTLQRFEAGGTRVVVEYSGEPGTASGVAHAVDLG